MRWKSSLNALISQLILFHVILSDAQQPKLVPGYGKKPGMTEAQKHLQQQHRKQKMGPETKDYITETLLIRPLSDGKVLSHFEFDYLLRDAIPRDPRTLGTDDEAQHYEFFPLALGQILREYAVAEMHLSLNSGRWRYESWGYPETPAVSSGAELWVWMAEGGPMSIDERWIGLSNALAGLFCASLSSLPRSRTSAPKFAFRPEGKLPLYPIEPVGNVQVQSTNATSTPHLKYHLRHASLPSEQICTENLTPFIKLLPCQNYAGFAELLNPHRLFGGDWYGIGIHATWNNDKDYDPEEGSYEEDLSQESSPLFGKKAQKGRYNEDDATKDPSKSKSDATQSQSAKKPPNTGVKLKMNIGAVLNPWGPSSVANPLQSQSSGVKQWDLESLFGRNVTKICPATQRADIRVLREETNDNHNESIKDDQSKSKSKPKSKGKDENGKKEKSSRTIQPDPAALYHSKERWLGSSDGQPRLNEQAWDVLRIGNNGLNMSVVYNDNLGSNRSKKSRTSTIPTPLSLTRHLRGSDQTRGGFSVTIRNELQEAVDAWYIETVPWIIRVYLSTLRVSEVFPIDGPLQDGPSTHPDGDRSELSSNQYNHTLDAASILNLRKINYSPPLSPSSPLYAANSSQLLHTSSLIGDKHILPTLLEVPLTLPPRSVIRLDMEFEKIFLKYTEHPPDAQRGWDIPSGVLVPYSIRQSGTESGTGPGVEDESQAQTTNSASSSKGIKDVKALMRMYTTPLLADLATPDFSMPYNVIILSGALVALLFGMLFNMLTRRFVFVPI